MSNTIIKGRVMDRPVVKSAPIDSGKGLFNRPVLMVTVADLESPSSTYHIRQIFPNTPSGHDAATAAQESLQPGDLITATLDHTSLITLAVATQIIKTPVRVLEPSHESE